jgi:transposase, IS5 family
MLSKSIFGEGMEDAIYDSQANRRFIGIDLTVDTAPDATTLLKFRRLLETHNLTKVVFDTINSHLAAKGLLLKEGTIVDATTIAAPPSAKNKPGERDPEMRQAKKSARRSALFDCSMRCRKLKAFLR